MRKEYKRVMNEIKISMPGVWDDIRDLALDARDEMVVFNLEKLDEEKRQKAIDFLAGGAFVLGSELHEISSKVYMILPLSVELIDSEGLEDEGLKELVHEKSEDLFGGADENEEGHNSFYKIG